MCSAMLRFVLINIAISCILHVNAKNNTNIDGDTVRKPPTDYRKQYNYNKYYKKRSYANEHVSNKKIYPEADFEADSDDNMAMTINKGIKKIFVPNNVQSKSLDKLTNQVLDYFKNNIGPNFRSNNKYGIQSEVVHLNNEKPTVKFEMNPQMMVKLINDILKSDTFNKSFDSIVKHAGIIYRTFQGNQEHLNN